MLNIMQFVRVFVAAALLPLVVACSGQPPHWYRVKPSGLMAGEQIQQLIAGGSIGGYNQFGNPYTITYGVDHQLTGYAGWKKEFADKGAWWVESNQMCWKWQNWRNAETFCYETAHAGRYLRWFDETGEQVSQATFSAAARSR
jgi:hypothetical protein